MLKIWDEAIYLIAVSLALLIFWLGWNKFLTNKLSGKKCGRFIAYLYISLAILGINLPGAQAQEIQQQSKSNPNLREEGQQKLEEQRSNQNDTWLGTPEWQEFKKRWHEYQDKGSDYSGMPGKDIFTPLYKLAEKKKFPSAVLDIFAVELNRVEEHNRMRYTRMRAPMVNPENLTFHSFKAIKAHDDSYRNLNNKFTDKYLNQLTAGYNATGILRSGDEAPFLFGAIIRAEEMVKKEREAIKYFLDKGMISKEVADKSIQALDKFLPTALTAQKVALNSRYTLEEHPAWKSLVASWKELDTCTDNTPREKLELLRNRLSNDLNSFRRLSDQGYLDERVVRHITTFANNRMSVLLNLETTPRIVVPDVKQYEKQIDEIIKLKAENKIDPQTLEKAQKLAEQSLVKTMMDATVVYALNDNLLNDLVPRNAEDIFESAQKRADQWFQENKISKVQHDNFNAYMRNLKKELPEVIKIVRKLRE